MEFELLTECIDWRLYGKGIMTSEPNPTDPAEKQEFEQEQKFIRRLFERLAPIHCGIADLFHLRVYEVPNHLGVPEWEILASNYHKYNECGSYFRETEKKKLYNTCLSQYYVGLHHTHPSHNYGGQINIEVVMFGQKEDPTYDWHPNYQAKTIALLAFLAYQQEIVESYPEWATHYINAPAVNTWKISCLN